VATSVNWVGNLLVALTFLDLTRALRPHGAFWLYAAVAAAGWVYLYAALPGASLHDSTFSRAVWRLYGGAKGLVMWY
jgi:hypothetical protein